MPPYRLQTLLEIRERAKEAAEKAFTEAVQALAKERNELKRLEEDLQRRRRERKEKVAAYLQEVMAKGTEAGGLANLNRFENRLRDDEIQIELNIERQKEAVKVAERQVEDRRLEMAEAAKELKAIEKHQEHWKKEIKYRREMLEEAAQDEIGNALHLARTRDEAEADHEPN